MIDTEFPHTEMVREIVPTLDDLMSMTRRRTRREYRTLWIEETEVFGETAFLLHRSDRRMATADRHIVSTTRRATLAEARTLMAAVASDFTAAGFTATR